MFEPDTGLLGRCDDATGVSVVGVSDYKRRQPLSRHVSPPHPGEEGTSRHTTPSLLQHSRHTFAFSSLFPSEPTSDVTLLFQTISGVNKDSLLVGKEGVAAMLADTPSGEYLQQAITSLQTHFFLPPVFSNTTIGAVAVREAITAGKSTILQQILHIQFATVSDPHGKPLCFFTTKHTLGALTYVYLSVLQSVTLPFRIIQEVLTSFL